MLRIFAMLCTLIVASYAHASDFNATVTIGSRTLDEKFWAPVDSHTIVTIFSDIRVGDGHFYVSGGFSGSEDNATTRYTDGDDLNGPIYVVKVKAEVNDAFVGMKFQPQIGNLNAYVGAGALYTSVHARLRDGYGSLTDKASSGGIYAHAGVGWRWEALTFGVEIRQVAGTKIDLLDRETDVDGTSISAGIGFDWGL